MVKAPRFSGKKLISLLKQHGFVVIRVKGSHHFLRHPDGRCTVVPVHAGETLGPGLLADILNNVELSIQDLQSIKKST